MQAPTWLWDGARREQHALALQAGSCQGRLQQSCVAAAAGDLQQADGHFNSALKAAAQMAGLRQTRPQSSQPPRLSDFPWFDSWCVVLRSQLRRAKLVSPIDALSSYCAIIHMEMKTKVMVVSPVPTPAVAFSRNDNPIEQVTSFKYLGLHFHQ